MSLGPTEKHVSLIADLDAFKSDKVGFKFNDVIHILRPVTVDQMMNMELARIKLVHMLTERAEGLALSGDDVYQRYCDFITPIVPSLTYAEIRSMTVVQLNEILNLVFRTLTGDPTLYTQKKNPQIPIRGL